MGEDPGVPVEMEDASVRRRAIHSQAKPRNQLISSRRDRTEGHAGDPPLRSGGGDAEGGGGGCRALSKVDEEL